jgi:hypothetical protein
MMNRSDCIVCYISLVGGGLMPNTGDSYTVTIRKSHLKWGTYRYSNTRDPIYGEGYIRIPLKDARTFGIFNSNNASANTQFNCKSVDGYFNGVLLAQGSNKAGAIYAKQFAEQGNLKGIGNWYAYTKAKVDDQVRVTWISPTDIIIELLRS